MKDEASGLSSWLPDHIYGAKARYDWRAVKADVQKHGVYNSLLIALMPTATTSQILGMLKMTCVQYVSTETRNVEMSETNDIGNSESFEPRTSNVFMRRTHAGDFRCVNRHLVSRLQRLNLWTLNLRNRIVSHGGSVQRIMEIPEKVRNVFKTASELKFITMIKMSAERSPFICQSQRYACVLAGYHSHIICLQKLLCASQ